MYESKLIKKINIILNEFVNYEKAKMNSKGDIIVKLKETNKRSNNTLLLTNVFKKIIANDIKKNRV